MLPRRHSEKDAQEGCHRGVERLLEAHGLAQAPIAYRSGRLSWVKAHCLIPLLLLDIEGE